MIIVITGFLLATLLVACQPAPNPTQRPKTGSATPEHTDGDDPSRPTSSPTPKHTPVPSPTPQPESLLDVDSADLQGVEVQYWHVWPGEESRLTEELVEEFNTSNEWGLHVEATRIENFNDLFEQVSNATQEENSPDLVVAFDYQALAWDAEREIVVDLSSYVDDPIWGWNEVEQADFYPIFWQQGMVEDMRIGIPAQRSGQLLYYNTSWAEELGFRSPPTTPTQFRVQACAAARANQQDDTPENDNTGGWIISTDYSTVLAWLHAFGSKITRTNGNGYRLNTPEVEDAFSFLRELYEDGCAWLPEDSSIEDEFASRRGLFAAGSVMGIPFQQAAFSGLASDDEWTAIPFPSNDSVPAISVYGPSFVLLESTPEKQLGSWLFIKWLMSAENQARWVEATTAYPLRASVLDHMDKSSPEPVQWDIAVELLEYGQAEPKYRSWDTVRWAISDAATQLFRWYFTIDQLPDTLRLLERTAVELHNRAR